MDKPEPLDLFPPVEEFERFGRRKIETLSRLGEDDQLDLYVNALELGKMKLEEVRGARRHAHPTA